VCLFGFFLATQSVTFQNISGVDGFLSFTKNYNCSVPENILTPPTEGIGMSWGVGGSVRPKNLKKMYEAQSEFPEGWGDLEKIPSVG